MNDLEPDTYFSLLEEIKQRVRKGQYDALKAVNKELVSLCWDIGYIIDTQRQECGWGTSFVENLSHDLRKEFPGIGGFSPQNLWYMAQFYTTYRVKKDSNHWLEKSVGVIIS